MDHSKRTVERWRFQTPDFETKETKMKWGFLSLAGVLLAGWAFAAEVPSGGPKRLEWMREHLGGTVSKFEFTQGYAFRKEPDKLRPFLEAIKARGFNTWDQMPIGGIWNEEQVQSLRRTLRVANEVGLKVWATLSPPSGTERIARMPLDQQREYYYATAECFAQLAREFPNFVAFTCDDTDYNWRLFTPEMLREMARRWRAICPRLAFLPLVYWGFDEELFETRGEYFDGIVFHYRAGSYPYAYLPGYDPKNFDMYGDVMRYELKRVRQMAGDHPVVCGIYLWYYEQGWGVLTLDEKNPNVEHVVRDAVQKLEIAREYADGVRVYGVGIDHEAYQAMGKLLTRWQTGGEGWGRKRGDPESHLERWHSELGKGPFLGTLLNSERAMGRDLPKACPWPRVELVRRFQAGEFRPSNAAELHPLILVSKADMPRHWPGLLGDYAREGGTLMLEHLPGWRLDTEASPLREGETGAGDEGVLTLQFADLSGIDFHYERRGFATRWRVVKKHPLTEGLGEVGVWQKTSFREGESTYGYLVNPVKPNGAEVLVEVEHESCPYDGVHYARQGKINGTYPLLTANPVGKGLVARHYAAVSPDAVFADAYPRLLANLLDIASTAAE